jgi:hypothetical protein
MKQKYEIRKDKDNKELVIREFAELDKDALSLLCEQTYREKTLKAAIKKGRLSLIAALRTPNMYPAGVYADRLADAVIDLYKSKDLDATEVLFDDLNLVSSKRKKATAVVAPEPDTDVDDLLEADDDLDKDGDDTIDDDFEDKPAIDQLKNTVKAETDSLSDLGEDI